MPAIHPPANVLVTGASGFIAIHLVKRLVREGYHVRGTVRSASKGDFVAKVIQSDRFEYCIVPDMESPNAYDEAVVGMDAVEHTASIVKSVDGDPDGSYFRLILPRLQG